ncbi:MAG: hypothetical protein RLZZ241_1192 [Bacteroidota bacterium]|jgi:transcriptional regulator
MYIPQKYKEENPERIRQFIEDNAFGILVSGGTERPMATHLPLAVWTDEQNQWVLEGHFAKANPQWRAISDGEIVLCIFNGPHAYISSSWYREEDVPTWNYQAVHIRGRYKKLNNTELLQALSRMMNKYEQHSDQPVTLHKLSPTTLKQIHGIVGFRIETLEVEAAFKLSQGRVADHSRIKEELKKRGGMSSEVANAMEE